LVDVVIDESQTFAQALRLVSGSESALRWVGVSAVDIHSSISNVEYIEWFFASRFICLPADIA
jgi:hypothetical protein